jgi:hypothetical protein
MRIVIGETAGAKRRNADLAVKRNFSSLSETGMAVEFGGISGENEDSSGRGARGNGTGGVPEGATIVMARTTDKTLADG